MAELRSAYLIHGDDHGAITERRARLKALAESQSGTASVEVLDGDGASPASVAAALAALTLMMGRRVIIVDGVERYKEAEVKAHLAPALAAIDEDTTVAFFAREEGRQKVPTALHDAVRKAGGQIAAELTIKPWELPRWTRETAGRLGIKLDNDAARALVGQVGERQQRLLRELEKLALEADALPVTLTVADIEDRAASSAQWRAYALADALVAGDTAGATHTYLRLREQGERLPGLMYLMAQRLRDALSVAVRLENGESTGEIKRSLRMPPKAADRFIADVRRRDADQLRRALQTLADLELDSRGGALVHAHRSGVAGLGEDTLAIRAIAAISG
jgi:DNA polymerase-3 subunit delta